MSLPVVPAPSRRVLHPWEWRVIWLLVLCFALRNLPWRLDDLDQAKQANVSLEMVGAGHWMYQHTPGGKAIATKPPLVGWMSAGVYALPFVGWDVAWRLPSLVAALALVYALWRAGETLWPARGGVVAVAAYGFNLLTPRLSTLVRTDMPLAFFIAAVGLIVWHHSRDAGQRPWTAASRWAVFALLFAGMMTKGPVVYAFLLPGMLAHGWVTRRRGGTFFGLWGGWWHWTLPLAPFLLWTLYGMASVPGFYAEVIGKEFFGRFTVGEKAVHHNQPVWFYLTQMLRQWFPWNVLLVAVAGTLFFQHDEFRQWRRAKGFWAACKIRLRQVWDALCREPGLLWLVCWTAGGFVLMSLVPSKRTDRIYPVVPPLALVLTALIARAQRQVKTPAAPALAPTTVPPPLPTAPTLPMVPHWPWDWARRTTAVAVAFGLGSVGYYIVHAYVQHEHSRASFAAHALRDEAGKTVALVVGKTTRDTDETMLVYLRQLAYLSPAEAIQRWSTGRLDAVVVNESGRAEFGHLLEPFAPTQPVLETVGSDPAYLLLAGHRPDDKHKTDAKPPGGATHTR